MDITNGLNLLGTAIRSWLADPVASDPVTPLLGQIWSRTDEDGRLYVYDGTNPQAIALLSDIGGAAVVPALWDANSLVVATSDNSPFALQMTDDTVLAFPAGGPIEAMSVADFLSMIGVTAGATPDMTGAAILAALLGEDTSALDAGLLGGVAASGYATIAYADAINAGLQPKTAVNLVATSQITLSGHQTIDGVLTTDSMRVLVTAQATSSTNGIFTPAAGAWQRTADANTPAELDKAVVSVLEGTVNVGSKWRQSATITTIDVDPIIFEFDEKLFIPPGFVTNAMLEDQTIMRKNAQTIGNGSLSVIPFTHGLGTKDIRCSLRRLTATNGTIDEIGGEAKFRATGDNTAEADFSPYVPETGEFEVITFG